MIQINERIQMKVKLIATLVSAALMTACSSTSSSGNTPTPELPMLPAPELPIAHVPTNPDSPENPNKPIIDKPLDNTIPGYDAPNDNKPVIDKPLDNTIPGYDAPNDNKPIIDKPVDNTIPGYDAPNDNKPIIDKPVDNTIPGYDAPNDNKPVIDKPVDNTIPGYDPDKPGYGGIEVEERGGVYYISKNGVVLGAIFNDNDGKIIWNPSNGEPVEITKDLINGFNPDKPAGIHPDKPGYGGIEVEERGGVYYITKNGVVLGAVFNDNDGKIIWNPSSGDPIEITKDLINGFNPDKPAGIHPDKPGYGGIEVEERGGVYYISKNGVVLGAVFNDNDGKIIWNPSNGEPVEITKDLINGFNPDKPAGIHPDKPGYGGIEVEERGGVYYISKNGVVLGAVFNDNDGKIIWNPSSGDPVEITKDLVNGKVVAKVSEAKANMSTEQKSNLRRKVSQIRDAVKARLNR